MLLTITTTYQPASDLGYLLHKNPDRLQTFGLNFGQAHVFYPEVSEESCTVALLLDIDTVHLVRKRDKSFAMEQYVNDRPYVASSFLSVALAEVFSTALAGRCKQRPELVITPIPLQATIAALPSRGGKEWLERLFEPLGYTLEITSHLLDERHPDWGNSPYYTVALTAVCCLSELLTHLYVLIPVLDGDKHYWIGSDEVEKLLRHGNGWLGTHPERQQIAYRYLNRKRNLAQDALARLIVEEQIEEQDQQDGVSDSASEEEKKDGRVGEHQKRLDAALAVIIDAGATSVLDLGCGEGKFLKMLMEQKHIERILGIDVSYRVLERAQTRLHLDRLPERQKERISLMHGALTYRDERLAGYDAAAVIEVIEHLDPARLAAFERVLFEYAHPKTVVITTPNAEYNRLFSTLQAGAFRHEDHRFEWTREEFQNWARQVSERFGYTVSFAAVGSEDPDVGSLSQMGVFSRSV